MEGFFKLLFGGLAAVFLGIGVSWLAREALQGVPASLVHTIRYSADEGEADQNLLAQAAQIFTADKPARSGGISAAAYVMRDLTTGTVVAQKDKDRRMPIASLTKLVTAVVARKAIPDSTKITLTKDAVGAYGDSAGLRVGEILTVGDLMYPLLMVSSNDAAEAIARQYGSARFVKAMNEFAQSIGAYRSSFADASGLSARNESSADDIALILDWVRLNDPGILEITELKAKTVRGHTWVNPAHFLSLSSYLGGKNGYTDEAENTTASLFVLGPQRHIYAVVLLGSSDRDGDAAALLKKVQ